MLEYILKSGACMAVFFLFYKLFLERENMHVFKRFYLLTTLLLAFGIPLVTFTHYITPVAEIAHQIPGTTRITESASQGDSAFINLPLVLWSVYSIGVLLLSFKFFKNLLQILNRIHHNPKHKINSITHVLLKDSVIPHTFFRYIFLNKRKFKAQQIPREVLLHEETHAKQGHSLDILFIEVLQILFWFNPFLYLIKHAIKLNHEFLADREVIQKGAEPATYQNILLAFSSPDSHGPILANALNYSSIKKRFIVMKTNTSKKSVRIRSMLLLPLLAVLLYGFSNTMVVVKENPEIVDEYPETFQENVSPEMITEYNALAKKYASIPQDERKVRSEDLKRMEHMYSLMTKAQKKYAEPLPGYAAPPDISQDGATKKQIAEYNALAKKYNAQSPEHMSIRRKDVDRLEYLYSIMTNDQKVEAESFPEFPPMPEPPLPPAPPEVIAMEKHLIQMEEQAIVKEKHAVEMERLAIEMEEQATVKEKHAVEMERLAIEMEEQMVETEKQVIVMEEHTVEMEKHAIKMEEEAVRVREDVIVVPSAPPIPPAPKSPLQFVREMKKQNAIFYYDGKKITPKKAIELIKKSDDINIDARHSDGKRPVVRLSTDPIVIED